MKSFRYIRDIFAQRNKKSLRLGLLLVAALFISSGTALVYNTMIYEKPLNVGNSGSVATGPGSTKGVSLSPPTILVLATSALVVCLSIFGFLREARKHIRISFGGDEPLPTSLGSTAPGAEEWEESLKEKEEDSSALSSG
jgi:hypothetical protein